MFKFNKDQLKLALYYARSSDFITFIELAIINEFIKTMTPGIKLRDERNGEERGYMTALFRQEGKLVAQVSEKSIGGHITMVLGGEWVEINFPPKPATEESDVKPAEDARVPDTRSLRESLRESSKVSHLVVDEGHRAMLQAVLVGLHTTVAEALEADVPGKKTLAAGSSVYCRSGGDSRPVFPYTVYRVVSQYNEYTLDKNGDLVDTLVFDPVVRSHRLLDSRALYTYAELMDLKADQRGVRFPEPSKELLGEFLFDLIFTEKEA